MDCIWVNLKTLVQPFSNLYQFISKCHLRSWKITLSSCHRAKFRDISDPGPFPSLVALNLKSRESKDANT